jgi:hypothetical protein
MMREIETGGSAGEEGGCAASKPNTVPGWGWAVREDEDCYAESDR